MKAAIAAGWVRGTGYLGVMFDGSLRRPELEELGDPLLVRLGLLPMVEVSMLGPSIRRRE